MNHDTITTVETPTAEQMEQILDLTDEERTNVENLEQEMREREMGETAVDEVVAERGAAVVLGAEAYTTPIPTQTEVSAAPNFDIKVVIPPNVEQKADQEPDTSTDIEAINDTEADETDETRNDTGLSPSLEVIEAISPDGEVVQPAKSEEAMINDEAENDEDEDETLLAVPKDDISADVDNAKMVPETAPIIDPVAVPVAVPEVITITEPDTDPETESTPDAEPITTEPETTSGASADMDDATPPVGPPPSPPATPDAPSPVPPASVPAQPADERITMGILGRDNDVERAARAHADDQLNKELQSKEGNFFKKLVRRVWKGGIANEYYRQKYIRGAKSQIQSEQDVLLYSTDDKSRRDAAAGSILERFRSGRYFVDESVGETYNELAANSAMSIDVRNLVFAAAQTGATAQWSQERIQEVYQQILERDRQREDSELEGGEKVTTTDVIEVIEALRGRNMHNEALQHAVANMRIVTGETRTGGRTEANYSTADKLIERLGKNKWLGRLVPEAALTVGVSLAFTIGNLGRGFVARSVGLGTPGVLGAVIGGAKAKKRASNNIAMRRRDSELGKIFGSDDKFNAMQYPHKFALDLRDEIAAATSDETLNEGGDNELKSAFKILAEAKVRREFTNHPDKDKRKSLIAYNEDLVEDSQKMELRKEQILAFGRMTERLQNLDPATRQRLGIAENATLTQVIQTYEAPQNEEFTTQIEAADSAAKSYKIKQYLAGAAMGAIISVGASEILQEGAHLISEQFAGSSSTTNMNLNGNHLPQGNPANHLSINDGNSIVEDPNNHTFSVKDSSGHDIVSGLEKNPDGSFTPKSLDALKNAPNGGINVQTTPHAEVSHMNTVPIDQYVHNNPAEFQHLDVSYMNNDTQAFDLNEQGGAFSANPDGTVTVNQNMTADGSFHEGSAIDMTSQPTVLDMELKQPDGTSIHKIFEYGPGKPPIPHPWADQLYQKSDGNWGFKGNGLIHWGKSDGTTFYSAASIPGDGQPFDIPTKVIDTPAFIENKLSVSTVVPGSGGHNITPIIIAEAGSNGIKEAKPASEVTPETPPVAPGPNYGSYFEDNYGYGEGDISEEEINDMAKERSPRLVVNPEAVLNPKEELDWYRDELAKRRGPEGLKKLEDSIDSSKELREMSGETETIITVPVAAIQEADTIYETLSLYGKQSSEALKKSLVLLNLNWLDEATSDPVKLAAIEKSRSEIERVRQEFPELQIAVVENEYNTEKVKETGGVIGYVAADLADSALLAIQKRMYSGEMNADHEVLIIRNDADPEGLSVNYLDNYQKALHDPKNSRIDVFKGTTRFGAKWAEKYPGFAVASNFAASLSIMLSSRGMPATGGANFAIKASMLGAIGGLGVMHRTGAGSDDGALGRRIRLARWGVGVFPRGSLKQETVLPNGQKVDYRAVAAHVSGAVVDTNPSRLVPYYLQGRSYTDAWGSDFAAGDGGYRERAGAMQVTPDGKSEIAGDLDTQFKGIEQAITSELRWNGGDDAKRVLSIFFSQIPGGYRIRGELGSNDVSFQLTDTGKKYLQKRFERESYGKKLFKSQYSNKSAPMISAT